MNNVQLSIIVPIYNNSIHLRKCLDSITGQSLTEIEIILINDCSPDPEDEKICQEYQRRDSRIIYLHHTRNLGPGGARNTGIQHASAPYLGFVDGDDTIHPDMYLNLLNNLLSGDYDFVQCRYEMINLSGKSLGTYPSSNHQKLELSGLNIADGILESTNQLISLSCFNKVWKKELLIKNNIKFTEKLYYEDLLLLSKYTIYTKKVLLIPQVYYYYLIRDGSISTSYTTKHIEDYFHVQNDLKKFLSEQNERTDWLNWYNAICRSELRKCVNKAYSRPDLQTKLLECLKNDPHLQHLNYSQLRFVINFMNGQPKKRLRLLVSEVFEQLGLREPLKKYLLRR